MIYVYLTTETENQKWIQLSGFFSFNQSFNQCIPGMEPINPIKNWDSEPLKNFWKSEFRPPKKFLYIYKLLNKIL